MLKRILLLTYFWIASLWGQMAWSHEDCFLHALSKNTTPKKSEFREQTPEGEKRFNQILDVLQELFEDEVQKRGGELRIVRYEYPFNSLNVRMRRGHHGNDGPIWRVIPTGGIFRHKLMNDDAFTLITCHEIGHHIGGLPKKWGIGGEFYWSTTEGQADYFAALKCFRQFAETVGGNQKFLDVEKDELLDTQMKKRCQQTHPTREAQAICLRTARAGIVMARFISDYRDRDLTELTPHVPDSTLVDKTQDQHPEPQCRLDTYINGALCPQNHWELLDGQALNRAACATTEIGGRPRCWFNPKTPYLPSQRKAVRP